jgi:hypothetical protein
MAKIEWSQIAGPLIVGAILGGGGAYIALSSRISHLEGQLAATASSAPRVGLSPPEDAPRADSPTLAPKPPDSLIAIVADLQRSYVRESFGELAGQNFSDQDLSRFQNDRIPIVITDSLRHDARFLSTVLGLQGADAAVQQRILREANRPLHRSWTEIGRISREGQTEAGNRAERLIAAAVVALAQELLRIPADSLRRLAVP